MMKYNIYRKYKPYNFNKVYAKLNGYDKHEWVDVDSVNNEYFIKNYTKASFNIFEAKQFIASKQSSDKQDYPNITFDYWIEEIED